MYADFLPNLIVPKVSDFWFVNEPFLWRETIEFIRITMQNPYGKFEIFMIQGAKLYFL